MGKDQIDLIENLKENRYEAENTMKLTKSNNTNEMKLNYVDKKCAMKNWDRRKSSRRLTVINNSFPNNDGSCQYPELKLNDKILENQSRAIDRRLENLDRIVEKEEYTKLEEPSLCKDDSFSLSTELHELSMEISNLNFHPGVFKIVETEKKKPERATRLKMRNKKFLSPVIEKQEDVRQNKANEKKLRIKNFELKIEKQEENDERKIDVEEKVEIKNENGKEAEQSVDKVPPESVVTEQKSKYCVSINEQDGNTDYNDLKNLTFCKKEKTSSVSSYTPTTSTDESNDIQAKKSYQKIVKVDVHSTLDKSKINQTTQSVAENKKSWMAKFKSKKKLYPDLKSQTVDEIGELNFSKDISLTPKKRKIGAKFRRMFHSSPGKEKKSLNNKDSRKPSCDNKLKNFTDKIKNKFSNHPKPIYLPDLHFPIATVNYQKNDHRIQELMQELQIQQTIIHQANKALTLCHNRKEFNASEEQIQSQRSLLLGTIKTKATLDEIDRLVLQDELDLSKKDVQSETQAEIRINCIELLLRRDVIDELERKKQSEFFVVVIVHRRFVWTSKVLYNPYGNLNIVIPEKIVIPDVDHNFKLKVQVYSMKMNILEMIDHENKYRINKRGKLMKKWFSNKSAMKNPDVMSQDSQFELVGELELSVEDLRLKSPWPLNKVPKFTSLNNVINLNMSCKVNQTAHHSGFVNYGYIPDGYAAWNRRWCVLDDHVLNFWNYPQQESEPPILVIDLINCVMPKIEVADRVMCAKPKTLIIDTVSKSNSLETRTGKSKRRRKIQRHMFSFDTNEEMYEWMESINQVLSSLQKWNRTLYEEPEKSRENIFISSNTDEDEILAL